MWAGKTPFLADLGGVEGDLLPAAVKVRKIEEYFPLKGCRKISEQYIL